MKVDPAKLEIFKSLYSSVAEEMGVALRRSAFSPNIKERRDYSCAVFDCDGTLIAQGDHMPVHLGSMPMSVRAALQSSRIEPGDVIVLNDPYAGGTHLPDITLVAGVYEKKKSRKPLFYVANRAHHADVGGANPGSMGKAEDIFQEGLRIPPCRLRIAGEINRDVMCLISANVRAANERMGDLTAQLGAISTGESRLLEIVGRYGFSEANSYAKHLIAYAAQMMRRVIEDIEDGVYEAEDYLDGDGFAESPVRIAVRVVIKGDRATVDFTGSNPQVRGPINAVEAITVSAVYYVFRCLISGDVPASWGIMEPLTVIAPAGSVVAAGLPAPVAAGNVETSQRIVDTLLLALSHARARHRLLPIPAASQGTMNNLTIGGIDRRTGQLFAYYETVAGGMGARPGRDGLHAVHTHMTNSLNTPAEALEYAYPLRVTRYEIRRGSGGRGLFNGGDGITREIELLSDSRVSILSDRRNRAPYGLNGGHPGSTGRNILVKDKTERLLGGKESFSAGTGDRIRIETPGGGGYGKPTR